MVSAKQDMVTLSGRTDVAHIPYQPFWLLIVRGVQLLLAIIIMALAAYAGGGYVVLYGDSLAIFTFVWTLIAICYIEITTFWYPIAYNKYAHIILECFCVVFWLSTWGSLAALASAWDWGCGFDGADCVWASNGPINATKAAAALGAIEWILFIVTLITSGIYLHRHRLVEMQGATGIVTVEEHKMGTVTQQPVYVQQQPTVYNQAPVDPRYQNVNMA